MNKSNCDGRIECSLYLARKIWHSFLLLTQRAVRSILPSLWMQNKHLKNRSMELTCLKRDYEMLEIRFVGAFMELRIHRKADERARNMLKGFSSEDFADIREGRDG